MAYVQGRFEELVASEPGGLADLPASVLLELLQSEALAMSSELTALKACRPTTCSSKLACWKAAEQRTRV